MQIVSSKRRYLRLTCTVIVAVSLWANTYAQEETVSVQTVSTPDKVVFSDPKFSVLDVAKMWNLSVEEIERYQELIEIDRPFTAVGATMTPYEVLGKFATTPEEQAKYAELYIDAAYANHQRGLEWVIALEKFTVPRQLREAQLIAESALIGNRVRGMGLRQPEIEDFSSDVSGNESVVDALFYVPTPCDENCSGMFDKLRKAQKSKEIGTIHVIFTDLLDTDKDKRTVYRWAAAHDLNRSMVGPDKPVRIDFENKVAAFGEARQNRRAPLALDSTGQVIYQ